MTARDDIAARHGEKTAQGLEDLLDHAVDAATIVASGRSAYDEDRILRLAAEAVLIHVGEAVHRMSARFVADHPEIGLAEALANRHVVAHGYDIVDYALVWDTLALDVPNLARQVRAALGRPDQQKG